MLYDKGVIIKFEDQNKSLDVIMEFPPVKDFKEVLVRDGDTLISLANHYYRSSSFWFLIAEINAGSLDNPFELTTGMKLKIPNLS